MAQLNPTATDPEGRRSLKLLPAVDLTAMVDLAFLLITFFMLTTTLAKEKAIDMAMPVEANPMPIPESRTMNICLGKNNTIQWYMGMPERPLSPPHVSRYGKSGIRKDLIRMKQLAGERDGKGLIVLLKPSKSSSYRNLVDMLDELKITGISQYVIVDISRPELARMAKAGLY